ncbi:MAG: hypothetical protein ABIS01_03495, partial [Ferruginibacter sp.]
MKSWFVSALITIALISNSCSNTNKAKSIGEPGLNNPLPRGGKLAAGKPAGKGWVNLIASLDTWNVEKPYWTIENGILHGDYNGGKLHSYG